MPYYIFESAKILPEKEKNSGNPSDEPRIFYIDRGQGKNVLFFVHGWYQNARDSFGYYIDTLQDKYRVVALTLPGHGQSYKERGYEYSLDEAYRATESLLLKIAEDADQITVIGHSMGGFISMKLALMHSNLIQNLVLISPVGDFRPYEKEIQKITRMPLRMLKIIFFFRAMLDKYPFGDRKQIYDPEMGHRIPSRYAHYKIKMKNHPLYAAVGYMRSFSGTAIDPLVKHFHGPALFLYGSNDKLTPPSMAPSIATNMPRSVFRVVKNGGHNVHLTQKTEVLELIEHFLDEHQSKKSFFKRLFRRGK